MRVLRVGVWEMLGVAVRGRGRAGGSGPSLILGETEDAKALSKVIGQGKSCQEVKHGGGCG